VRVQAKEREPAAAGGTFNIRDFGARGDGKTADTAAINRAIEACSEAGGGQVRLPPGRYLSGTVHLKSHVTLKLDAGARLVGSTNLEHYQNFTPPPGMPESGWKRWHRALILGDSVENVAIVGDGIIDGNKVFDPKGEERMRGPHTVLLGVCRDVGIRDVSIRDSANYAIMLEDCQRVEVRNIRVTGGWDGVHFRGWPGRPCRDVTITGCQFYTGDDAIAGRYWERVLISNCIVNSSCNGIRLIGPAKHLIIHGSLFYGPGVHPHRTSDRHNMLAGINLQPGAWDATRGTLDDVLISDITMHNVATPFHFTLKPGNTARRIDVGRVTATGVYRAASSVESWAGTPFGDVVFRDVTIEYAGGGVRKPRQKTRGHKLVKPPGVDARSLPAWGFYARNVGRLRFENVRLSCAREDRRPVLIADRVGRLVLDGFRFSRPAGAPEPLALSDVAHMELRDANLATIEPTCLELQCVPGMPGDPAGPIRAGKPYSVRVTVESGGREGLGKVGLRVGEQEIPRWVWLSPGEKKEVLFRGLTAPAAGTHEVCAGELRKRMTVEP
jgi:hypothetical protein